MNISCSQCTTPFSITADQLGTRGKCPHCRATIILPKSATSSFGYDAERLVPPSFLTQNLFCGLTTIFLHLAVLIVIAMLPWGDFSDNLAGDGSIVAIGKLPYSALLDQADEKLDVEEMLSPENDTSFDELDTRMLSPTLSGDLSDPSIQNFAFAPNRGGQKTFEFESFHTSNVLAGGSEDFSTLVSRLNRDGLDIIITFDSTGSMQGEIDQVKAQIHRIGSVLFEMIDKTRIGICTYRDHGDAYLVQGLPLTDNLAEVVLFLEKISASGGGDQPEAVEEGLVWATEQKFRRSARKVILLFGDAPPRPDQSIRCQSMASEFRKQGGVISTVTCRKSERMDDFELIAQLGGGEAFLTTNVREIMTQLIVLVFGSKHREKVIQAFDLLKNN